MQGNDVAFVFSDAAPHVGSDDLYTIVLPRAIKTKEELLNTYSNLGRFPSYFGSNWDALLDCLRDFSWVRQKRIEIWHHDLPLEERSSELATYVEILVTALQAWRHSRPWSDAAPAEGSEYVDHELSIVFPSSTATKISEIIDNWRISHDAGEACS